MSLNTIATDSVKSRSSYTAEAKNGAEPDANENALSAISKYIPTEIVSLYLFGLSVIPSTSARLKEWHIGLYLLLVILTPIMAALIYGAKLPKDAKLWGATDNDKTVLVWCLVSPTIGFLVWGLAVPENKMVEVPYLALISFLAMLVSFILGQVEKYIKRTS